MKITLIRHGKPTAAINPILTASEFTNWVRHYNSSEVSQNSRPINESLVDYNSSYVVSSDSKRAIHSTNIYTQKMPDKTYSLFREMEIPRYKFPFRLKAWTWVYLNRAIWMLGLKGSFESYKQAKIRAEQAGLELIKLANLEGEVVLFGHGYLNLHIRKFLVKEGWLLAKKSNHYWGVTSLERD